VNPVSNGAIPTKKQKTKIAAQRNTAQPNKHTYIPVSKALTGKTQK
jgi:hypothetical protein